ncbi:hypothetical protein E3P98_01751 [Wallemia ichthyophaga]|nr:hypothetical protein E3P98_01751 [Wallemia ichthyophaga]
MSTATTSANTHPTTHAISTVLGTESYKSINSSKILIVGAGGIGCELLKNVILSGFTDVHIIDLDSIDLSNLNRQFLFQARHIKRSKAVVAKETASTFNPNALITPHQANVKETHYNVSWFAQFDVVLGALDNLDARRHVNKMCLAADTPLIESGTTGYSGNVQVIIKDKFECYDCQVKPTPKTYPVCTIRSTPSAPIHTIVWSKSYLLPHVFGEAEDEGELDRAELDGENGDEIKTLREEQGSFNKIREAVKSDGGPRVLFDKIFNRDVRRLLQMEDMWKTRTPPTPLEFDEAITSTAHPTSSGASKGEGDSATENTAESAIADQRKLTLADNVGLFLDATARLAQRSSNTTHPIEFDKDDRDTLEFVAAASNLRSIVYGIPTKTLFEVKEMAGNIIPAIATTNAIIAGVQTMKAINVLTRQMELCKPSVYLGSQLIAAPFETPNAGCTTCRDVYLTLPVKAEEVRLSEFIDALRSRVAVYADPSRELAVFERERLLYDPDFDENLDKTLMQLGCGENTFITLVDEDGEVENVTVVLAMPGEEKIALPHSDSIKQPAKKEKKLAPVAENSRKRGRDDDANDDSTNTQTYTENAQGVVSIVDSSDDEGPPPAKKMHTDGPITLDDSDDEGAEKGAEKDVNHAANHTDNHTANQSPPSNDKVISLDD